MRGFATIAGLGLAATLTLAACNGGSTTSAPVASAPSSGTTGATVRINANAASQAELEAAFATAGISDAARWAREVAEYRPYKVDPTWAQLRQQLGKYDIDPAVLERIIALLTL